MVYKIHFNVSYAVWEFHLRQLDIDGLHLKIVFMMFKLSISPTFMKIIVSIDSHCMLNSGKKPIDWFDLSMELQLLGSQSNYDQITRRLRTQCSRLLLLLEFIDRLRDIVWPNRGVAGKTWWQSSGEIS